MSVPIRSVLVVGGRDSGVDELLTALTGRKRNLTFPCLHRMREVVGEEVLQADVELFLRRDATVPAPGEPKVFDAVALVFHTGSADSADVLTEAWKDAIDAVDAPKIAIGTGAEVGVPQFIKDDLADASGAEPSKMLSLAKTAALGEQLNAAVHETSAAAPSHVRDVFTRVLQAAVDPSLTTVLAEEQVKDNRLVLFNYLRDANIGVPLKDPQKRQKSAMESKLGRAAAAAMGARNQNKWEVRKTDAGKVYYRKRGTKAWQKERPVDFDGDRTQEDREKTAKDRLEHEVDILRARSVAAAKVGSRGQLAEKEHEYETAFEEVMTNLTARRDALSEAVEHLQREYEGIKAVERLNEGRSERLDDLYDLKARTNTIVQERVSDDIDHEEKMEKLRAQFAALQKMELMPVVADEAFESAALDNRRLRGVLQRILEDSKAQRVDMQKQGDTIREMKAATDDEEKKRMAAEAKIQKARNEVMKLKEGISGQLKREKDWLTNELILQKGAEATAAQQLREWKREAKTLAMMIVEVDDRIAEQEVPIAAFLTEEKRKTKQRGGPLLLDDEDVLLCRERRRSRGGKTPSDKKLMQRLATDHDRLLLEYQFLCADLADCAAGTDELLDNLKQSLSSYIEGERAKSGSQHAVSESLHELLLVLHDLTKSRRRALERLDKTEAFAGDELLAIEDQLKGLEAYARDPPPEARNMPKRELRALLEERTEAVRVGMYEKTIQLEGIERVRRELSKASRAAASQKEKVNERLRDLEGAAEASERKVKELVCDVSEIIGVADTKHEPAAGHPSRTFLGKALVGLHQDTRAIVVKRCSGRLPLTPVAETCANSKKPPSAKAKNLLTGKPSTTSTRRCGASKAQTRTKMLPSDPATPSVATSASAAVAEYDTLVASLKQHFGVPAKSTKTSLESEWKSLW